MFDKKKAAEYFVVAWVKDWRMKTYLSAIGAQDLDHDKIHDHFPWMPIETHYYFVNQLIRAWTSMAMRPINDKLWNTDDNKKRLSLATQIENWSSDKKNMSDRSRDEAKERRQEMKRYAANRLGYKLSVATMRRGQGTQWNVVK